MYNTIISIASFLALITMVIAWYRALRQYDLYRRVAYTMLSSISVSTSVAFTINMVTPSYVSASLVFGLSAIIGLLLAEIQDRNHAPRETHLSTTYQSVTVGVVIFVFCAAFLLNIVQHSSVGQFIQTPIIGNNDDTATHVAMSIMTLKEKSLLIKNPILQSLIRSGIDYQNAVYYPLSVYTSVALLYESFHTVNRFIDIPTLFSIYSLFSFAIYMLFLFSIIDLSFALIRSLSSWAIPFLFVFSVFFIGGEYFMTLYRMSYLTQLAGNAFLLVLLRVLIDMRKEHLRASETMIVISLLGIGFTYYLFLPIAWVLVAARMIMSYTSEKVRFALFVRRWATVLLSIVLSGVPLALYATQYSIIAQITIPGLNLIILGSLIQFCLMILLFVIVRRSIIPEGYTLMLVAILASLVLALATVGPSAIKTGLLPYYFFKSFFTSATLATAAGCATIAIAVSHLSRGLHRYHPTTRFTTLIIVCVVLPMSFVAYLYSLNTPLYGYKAVSYIAQGVFNYYSPASVRKLNSLYTKHHDTRPAIYNSGYWGENILLFSLFENIPSIHVEGTRKRIFYFSSNVNFYMDAMLKDIRQGKDVLMFDGHGAFKPAKKK